jgi:hypothetical protein
MELTGLACDRIDEVFLELGVEWYKSGRRIMGCCPVHCGDNRTALNFYPEGDTVRGVWFCNTKKCHREHGKTLPGLISGILSREEGRKVPYYVGVNWLCKFFGYTSLDDVPIPSDAELLRRQIDNTHNKLDIRQETHQGWSRETVRSRLEIPSQYYLDRHYPEWILDKYDIGYSKRLNRTVVPIYNDAHTKCVGYVARSLMENPDVKWAHPEGFSSGKYLYNYWFARHHLYSEEHRNDTLILVEGPGDVWKLEMAGIHNSVAIFGCDLSPAQQSIIENSRAISIIVMLDNDEAGRAGLMAIKTALGRQFRLYFLTDKIKDGGDVAEGLNTDVITPDMELAMRGICNQNNKELRV